MAAGGSPRAFACGLALAGALCVDSPGDRQRARPRNRFILRGLWLARHAPSR